MQEREDAKCDAPRVCHGGGGMQGKTVGTIVLVVGVLILLVAAAADSIGLGGAPGFGWKQMVGVAVGVALAGVGIVRRRSSRA